MQNSTAKRRCRTISILFGVSLLSACAVNLTEEERQVQEFERFERKAQIQAFVAHCESQGRTVIYTGPSYQKLRDPIEHIPNHARLSEYRCASHTTVARQVGTGG